MDTILLGITVISLVVALVMSVSAWRLTRDDRQRSAARVAALSAAAGVAPARVDQATLEADLGPALAAPAIAPWAPAFAARVSDVSAHSEVPPHAFLGSVATASTGGGRQRTLGMAAVVLFVALSLGVVWTMSGPRGTTPRAMGPNAPLELISLRHDRQASKLAISGLVRNPVSGTPVDHLSAVVFLFDRSGAFVTSAHTAVDFVRLGVGDETPFVVTLDAPQTVTRYRVSFRTDDGIVPHIDRRGTAPVAESSELPVSVTLK